VFDHPFIIPGVLTITLSVTLAFLIGPLVIWGLAV
jgi:anaerobic C4-dicarboxylate transporter